MSTTERPVLYGAAYSVFVRAARLVPAEKAVALAGDALSLAYLHAAPMFAYFRMAPEGAAMLGRYPAIASWWDRIAMRPSMKATRSPWEADIE